MIELIRLPFAIACFIMVFLLQSLIKVRLDYGQHRPLHDIRIKKEDASRMELAVAG